MAVRLSLFFFWGGGELCGENQKITFLAVNLQQLGAKRSVLDYGRSMNDSSVVFIGK